MFSYIGVTAAQAILLKDQYHIYLLTTGRVALTGCKHNSTPCLHEAITHESSDLGECWVRRK